MLYNTEIRTGHTMKKMKVKLSYCGMFSMSHSRIVLSMSPSSSPREPSMRVSLCETCLVEG